MNNDELAWTIYYANLMAMDMHPGNKSRHSNDWSYSDIIEFNAQLANKMLTQHQKRWPKPAPKIPGLEDK